jgi:hypothetical protein
MTKALAVLAVVGVLGSGVYAVYAVGERADANFDALNQALTGAPPGEGKASASEVATWIERHRPDVANARCKEAGKGWDYVCVFRDDMKRRLKIGIISGPQQPTQMSLAVPLKRPLSEPAPG